MLELPKKDLYATEEKSTQLDPKLFSIEDWENLVCFSNNDSRYMPSSFAIEMPEIRIRINLRSTCKRKYVTHK